MLTEDQTVHLEDYAKRNGFRNYSLAIREGSRKGDNYLGIIYLIGITENDGSKEDHLVLKCALKGDALRSQMPIASCYSREVYLYETVLPAFKKLQESHRLPHPFKAYAKLHAYSLKDGDEWLLMEDITKRGFRMQNRKTTMDGDHVLTVIKEHAKFHSLSFVMKHFNPELFEELEENLQDFFKDSIKIQESFYDTMRAKFKTLYELFDGEEAYVEALKKCESMMPTFFDEMVNHSHKLVVVHGDSWCNNMMFKYEDEHNPTKPTELCLLDWQISKVTTPAHDLCYFMFPASPKEVLDDHISYLQAYHRVLKENLEAAGIDINAVFSFDMLMDFWKEYCLVGLYIAVTFIENLLKDETEAVSFTEAAESGAEDIFSVILGDLKTHKKEYGVRIKDVLSMLIENEYI